MWPAQKVESREKMVASLLSKQPVEAVKAALVDPPYNAAADSIRVIFPIRTSLRAFNCICSDARFWFRTCFWLQKQSAKVVIKALCAVPEKDIPATIDGLSEAEHDILMKYLYRGLEGTDSNAQLLKWHGALTEKAGLGCIMRALQTTNRL
jgi:hypothetical protein